MKATSRLLRTMQLAILAELCQQCEVRAMDNGSKICHDFWSLSQLRGCNPSELESLRPLGPGSAEIKLRAQSWGKRRSGAKWWPGNGSVITVRGPVAHRSLGSGWSGWMTGALTDTRRPKWSWCKETGRDEGQGEARDTEKQRHALWSLSKWE